MVAFKKDKTDLKKKKKKKADKLLVLVYFKLVLIPKDRLTVLTF